MLDRQPRNTNTVFNVAITIAEAKDIYFACKNATTSHTLGTNPHYQSIPTHIAALMAPLRKAVANALRDKIIQTANELTAADDRFANLPTQLDHVLTIVDQLNNNYQLSTHSNDINSQLQSMGSEGLLTTITSALTAFHDKVTSFHVPLSNNISTILNNVRDISAFTALPIPNEQIDPIKERLKIAKTALVTEFDLRKLVEAHHAFIETLAVSHATTLDELTKEEMAEVGDIVLKHYTRLDKSIPPVIVNCISHLSSIKPIYDPQFGHIVKFLDGYLNSQARFLAEQILSYRPAINDSLNALSTITVSFLNFREIFDSTLDRLNAEYKNTRSTAVRNQIVAARKYLTFFENHFVRPTRFAMPITAMRTSLHQLANQPRFGYSFLNHALTEAVDLLDACIDSVNKKTSTIDSLIPFVNFILELKTAAESLSSQPHTLSSLAALSPLGTLFPNHRARLLYELSNLFERVIESYRSLSQLSYRASFAFTSPQSILDEFRRICTSHKFKLETNNPQSRTEAAQIVLKIHTKLIEMLPENRPANEPISGA